MTHKKLVEIAYKWLLKNGGVGVAFKELSSTNAEIPDVIGFDSWQCILIECKVSRADFFADMKKPHRAIGMGDWKFYCCPKGLIVKEELPAKWGLIYVDENGKAKIEYDCRYKKIKEICESAWQLKEYPEGFYYRRISAVENKFESNIDAERRIMYSALRRLFIKGFMKHIYDKKYQRLSANEIIAANEPTANKNLNS